MFGTLSLKLGNVLGIPVRLHWTFLVLIYLLLLNSEGPLLQNAFVLTVLFGSVLLHELGHAVVARLFGIRVIDITFWPLGGMARMSEMPESSRVEGLVSLAGPAVNFLLVVIGLLAAVLLASTASASVTHALEAFVTINLLMGVFNLIPAFPMDGGRILRALLALRSDWLRATELAVAVGRMIAGVLFFGSMMVAFSHPQYLGFALVGAFVWLAGGRELLAVRMRHTGWPFGSKRGTPREATPWYRTRSPETATVEAAPGPSDSAGARRPHLWEFRTGPSLGDDAIRDLERYRGRLRRQTDEETA